MIKYCSATMTKLLIQNEIIKKDEYRIYEYGFETFLASLMNIVIILTIGYISSKFIHTLLFLITYSSVRQFSGGYHAKDHIRCFMTFIGIYIATLILGNYRFMFSKPILLTLLSISIIVIYNLAPLEHCNNPLNKFEKKRYKHIARGLVAALGMIALVGLFNLYLYQYSFYIIGALVWVGIMLISGYRKEGKK